MLRPIFRVILVAGLWCAACYCGDCWAQSKHLEFADKVRLLSCQPSTNKPAFRVKFNIVDAHDAPSGVDFPTDRDLRSLLSIDVSGLPANTFFAVSPSDNRQIVRGRVAMILVDISGSMNTRLVSGKTRFETAQLALSQFLDRFVNGVDRVAIVPFESHNVVPQIRSAVFATTKGEAQAQIAALQAPGPKNNTALYSAVVAGLQTLAQQSTGLPGGATSPESLLVVMTDGKNEVERGDDPDLLAGDDGLNAAAAAVQSSGIQVIGVGFGDPGSIDLDALQKITKKTYQANDLEHLEQIYTMARTLLANRIVATFESPWNDRASLEGKTLQIKTTLALPSGETLESDSATWSAPQIGTPAFDGECDTDELKAALHQKVGPSVGLISIIRPTLVFFGLGTVLLLLWFWVPRLVWPEQFIGNFPAAGGGRWAEVSRAWSTSRRKPSRPAPPGFQSRRGGGVPPRSPSDRTTVQPQPDFSKSRLQKRPTDDRD